MNEKQQRLVNFVRELNSRDQLGPDAFPILAQDAPAKRARKRILNLSPAGSRDLVTQKKLETYRRGLDIKTSISPPSPRPSQVALPILPSLTEEAAESFNRVLTNQPLSDADLIHLESIVLPALRPVFDIENESYATLPSTWDALNKKRTALEPLVRGIGRIQLTGHPSYTLVGTGFVCGPNAILTNRHVAQIFVQGVESGQPLSYLPGVSCGMEMLGEVGSASTLTLGLSRPISISTQWDVALLRVESLPSGVTPLPLSANEPAEISGGTATIIGYPSYDPYESFADQANIFRAIFDRKRLQPGKLNGRATVPSFGKDVRAIAHDCSTLGGNSGSALISVDTAKVVGVHFSGATHVSNYAVPVWELASDPAFAGMSLNLV